MKLILSEETIRRSNVGIFVARLPFKVNVKDLVTAYYTALQQLRSMERRFEKYSVFIRLYLEFCTSTSGWAHETDCL